MTYLDEILNKLINSMPIDNSLFSTATMQCNEIATRAIKEGIDESNKNDVYEVLMISNILYNNSAMDILPLEDGVYDLLVSAYNKYTGGDFNAPIGATPSTVVIDGLDIVDNNPDRTDKVVYPCYKINKSNMFFFNQITKSGKLKPSFFPDTSINKDLPPIQSDNQRRLGTKHDYPELVGTLDKCKFVMVNDVPDPEMLEDPSITIFERDFYHRINSVAPFNELIAELKYDGISVEATVAGDTIISARSRGDTKNNEGSDLTPIFGGYKFPNATGNVDPSITFGIQFECIITNDSMEILRNKFGKNYVNGRNAVVGITSNPNVGRSLVQYLTLVPIRTSFPDVPRQVDIEFLNKYYATNVCMKYSILSGGYNDLLYQVREFVKEADYLRPFMNFMYDGVVVSITDQNIIKMLGRKNSVNKYSIAIKFNAKKKQTIFTGYSFSVGQDGVVTPKAHFKTVEFLGTLHNKTTAHSYQRYKTLNLRYGDIVNIEYRNDVICYISKPDIQYNRANPNPIAPFPQTCPICGTPLIFSDKNAYCPNYNCKGRSISRVVNMLKKLNFKHFSTSYIEQLKISSFKEFATYPTNQIRAILGDKLAKKFEDSRTEFLNTPISDYRLLGSLGFTNISSSIWSLVLKDVSIEGILANGEDLHNTLMSIKGIGKVIADTICSELPYFAEDIEFILRNMNVERSYGIFDTRPTVRFTGVRDKALEEYLNTRGFDADGTKSVTRTTNFLVIPYYGFQSSKTKKAGRNCTIVTVEDMYKIANQ